MSSNLKAYNAHFRGQRAGAIEALSSRDAIAAGRFLAGLLAVCDADAGIADTNGGPAPIVAQSRQFAAEINHVVGILPMVDLLDGGRLSEKFRRAFDAERKLIADD